MGTPLILRPLFRTLGRSARVPGMKYSLLGNPEFERSRSAARQSRASIASIFSSCGMFSVARSRLEAPPIPLFDTRNLGTG